MRHNLMRCACVSLTLMLSGVAQTPPAFAQSNPDELRLYYSANGMLSRGLYDLAIDEYRAFLEAHPDHEKAPVASYGLSVALHRTKQYEDATPILQSLHSLDSFEFAPQVALLLGQCHIAQQQFEDAIDPLLTMARNHADVASADVAGALACEALFRAGRLDELDDASAYLEQTWPESTSLARARYFHSLSLMHRQRFEPAAERLETLINDAPDSPYTPQARLLLASCLEQTGALQSALRTYRSVLESGIDSLSPDALLGAASVLLRLDEPDEAARALDAYLDDHDEHSQYAHALHLRGRAAFDQAQYDEAMDIFDDASRAGAPGSDHSPYWAAKSALRNNDNADAAERLDDLLRDEPSVRDILPLVLYDHAVASTRADLNDNALESLDQLLDDHPDHELAPQALQLQATTLHELERYSDSQRATTRFLRDYPDSTLTESIAFLDAENLFLRDEFDDAADAYEDFLSEFPNSEQATDARFRLGDALYRLDDRSDAEPHLAQIASLDPIPDEYHTALWMLAQIAFDDQRYEQTTALLNRYLDDTPSAHAPDDALLKLGIAHQRLDDHDNAIETFSDLLSDHPDSELTLHAQFERGQSAMELKALNAAAHDFEAVLERDPGSRFADYARSHLGTMAQQAGDFETASDYFEQVGDNVPEAIASQSRLRQGQSLLAASQYSAALDVLDSYLDEYPDSADAPRAAAHRAIALARLEQHDDALEAINNALSNSESLSRPLTHSLHHERVRTLRALDRTEEARDAARDLLNQDPDLPLSSYVAVDLAQLESALGNHAGAAALLEQTRPALVDDTSTDAQSLYTQATYIHAVAEYNKSQHASAASLFEEYLGRDDADESRRLETMLLQGECLFAVGNHARASSILDEVAADAQDEATLAPALLRLGESEALRQRWDESERAFTRFLELFTEHAQWYQAQFGIGWARENQGNHTGAIDAYSVVAEQHQGPTAARAQFQLGECLFAQQKHEEAIREFLRVDVLYDYPEWSAAALYEAGQCFIALRRIPEARDQFQRVVDNHAETRWGQLAAQRLESLPETPALPGR
ncbi:MAG: tetratricopeptide repeat protein [Planctomycetota bacterium]|jgi:TolA-binding protein